MYVIFACAKKYVEVANEIQNIQAQPQGEIILYQPDKTVRLEVRLENMSIRKY